MFTHFFSFFFGFIKFYFNDYASEEKYLIFSTLVLCFGSKANKNYVDFFFFNINLKLFIFKRNQINLIR